MSLVYPALLLCRGSTSEGRMHPTVGSAFVSTWRRIKRKDNLPDSTMLTVMGSVWTALRPVSTLLEAV